jgi:hypothetical protein
VSLLTRWAAVSFAGRTVLRGVNWVIISTYCSPRNKIEFGNERVRPLRMKKINASERRKEGSLWLNSGFVTIRDMYVYIIILLFNVLVFSAVSICHFYHYHFTITLRHFYFLVLFYSYSVFLFANLRECMHVLNFHNAQSGHNSAHVVYY